VQVKLGAKVEAVKVGRKVGVKVDPTCHTYQWQVGPHVGQISVASGSPWGADISDNWAISLSEALLRQRAVKSWPHRGQISVASGSPWGADISGKWTPMGGRYQWQVGPHGGQISVATASGSPWRADISGKWIPMGDRYQWQVDPHGGQISVASGPFLWWKLSGWQRAVKIWPHRGQISVASGPP
jgi:hypothetical protein